MTTTAMVVMEPGSDWPGQVGDSTNVVAFGQGGEDLLRRMQEKLDALRRGRQSVRVAVLACNASTDDAAVGRRGQLARALLGAVTGTACGRVVLSASGRASSELRQELFALAGELTEELRGTTANVSLWFTEASRGKAVRLLETRTASMGGTAAPSPPAGART